ncbi:magnesium chelatase subunit D [Methylobacterium sp. Leaf88]|uniref:magnesium chelatase subunit D n=1 Tax=Methylobacterium sp. Leaf88 TaxID=1736244 RepID=UPI0006F4F164|nr:magnesium chelatase subunit D [Methylobacterium sp. Leaf88]KQO74438.1 magnesium chelatase ATPase subunit D [Methylobacterium sp. Leaf88]
MSPAWAVALRVAHLVARDPHACGGVLVRAGAGPVRDLWLDRLAGELAPARPVRRMPAGIADDRLLGGLDLAATLAAGRPVAQSGLLAEADGGLVVVPMAERLSSGTAARLAAALDAGEVRAERDGLAARTRTRIGLILLDEGEGDDAAVPEALADRLAFRLDLTGLAWGDTQGAATEGEPEPDDPDLEPDAAVADLCAVAAALGIASLRAPLLALRIARLLAGHKALRARDVREAACLVLAPRATRLPSSPEDAEAAPAERPESPASDGTESSDQGLEPGAESLVEAARAAIPPDLLARLGAAGAAPSSPKAGRVGAVMQAPRSGRPAGTRPGSPRTGRLALLPTLRAAAPWQRLRSGAEGAPRLIQVRSDDFRITRFRQRSETTTIFAVDASGSAALERLAEAKGAVELLLAEAYVRRDKVALVAFRGAGAEIVLAPTRALARARRGLSALPGGGGTPLASGLDAAGTLARAVRRGGGTPVVVVLTDGRANVARSGAPGRVAAGAEALNAAGLLRADAIRTILIDTAARPQETARRLAEAMGARYVPLPYADAAAMSTAIRSAR